MFQNLTPRTAIAYVQQHLIDLGYEPKIGDTSQDYVDDTRYIIVPFTMEIEGEICSFTFHVWLENGKLYGEW